MVHIAIWLDPIPIQECKPGLLHAYDVNVLAAGELDSLSVARQAASKSTPESETSPQSLHSPASSSCVCSPPHRNPSLIWCSSSEASPNPGIIRRRWNRARTLRISTASSHGCTHQRVCQKAQEPQRPERQHRLQDERSRHPPGKAACASPRLRAMVAEQCRPVCFPRRKQQQRF